MPDEPQPDHVLPTSLHDLLAETHDLPSLLDDLARLSAEHFHASDEVHCGIILRRDKKSIVVASSSARAAQMDEIQAGFGDGPCLEALRTGRIHQVPDVRTEQRWPEYMAVVREHGLASALAVPLNLGEAAQAAMTTTPVLGASRDLLAGAKRGPTRPQMAEKLKTLPTDATTGIHLSPTASPMPSGGESGSATWNSELRQGA